MKKVLCSAEKSSVIWAEPHGRSSAEQSVRSVTNSRNQVVQVNVLFVKPVTTQKDLNALYQLVQNKKKNAM